MQENKTSWMRKALETARSGALAGEVPIGAVVVDSQTGEELARAHNLVETRNDPAGHAEILALREAARNKGSARLVACDLYVTLEPCPMCAQAISFARIRKVVFGAYDPKGGGVDHGPRIFESTSCHHQPEVISGVEEQACGNLLRQFFQARRS